MTSIEVLRRLPRGSRYAIAERVEFIAEEQWTLEFVTAAINEILLDDARAVTVAESLLAEHPEAPLRIVDGQVIRPQIGSVLHALETVRTVEVLEPEPLGDVPGIPLLDLASVARMLDVTAAELDWFADHGQWLRHSSMPLRHYRVRRIAKPAGGVRVIEAPKPRLAEAQRRILRRVLNPVGAHPAARGFRRGGSVLAYASPHVGASSVVRLDLRDCFSTVTASRVRAAFRRLGYPSAVAQVLADLCTVATPGDALKALDPWQAAVLRTRHLPQGAPTSPALMNLVMHRLDTRLTGLARAQGARYTRYGDDLAFSGALDPSLLAGVVPKIVTSEGFSVNPSKTRVMRAGSRQELAGVVVNERAQAPRAEYDALRALLHNAARVGGDRQNRDDRADFRAYVYGRIAWVGQGNTSRRERLLAMAARVRW